MNIEERKMGGSQCAFPEGHPCRGCPYTYQTGAPGCIMGAVPGDCAWYFYRKMFGHKGAMRPQADILAEYYYFSGKQARIREQNDKEAGNEIKSRIL